MFTGLFAHLSLFTVLVESVVPVALTLFTARRAEVERLAAHMSQVGRLAGRSHIAGGRSCSLFMGRWTFCLLVCGRVRWTFRCVCVEEEAPVISISLFCKEKFAIIKINLSQLICIVF